MVVDGGMNGKQRVLVVANGKEEGVEWLVRWCIVWLRENGMPSTNILWCG